MPRQTYTRMQVPTATDSVTPLAGLFEGLANSARVIIPAAGPTSMAQVLTDATTAGFGPTAAAPLYVHRTDEDAVYINKGSGWVRLTGKAGAAPFTMAAGDVTYNMGGANLQAYTVTFPTGRFTTTPIILATATHALLITAGASSSTGTTITLRTADGSNSTNAGTARWIAVQMTPTTAGG